MNKELLAHSANKEWKRQSLEEHLRNTAQRACEFAEVFHCGDWAYNIGLLHDIGKASDAFQKYLEDSQNNDSDYDGGDDKKIIHRTVHSGAVAIFGVKRYKKIGKVLAYCIAGHHCGLGNWNEGNGSINRRIGENGAGDDKTYIDSDVEEYFKNLSDNLKDLFAPSFIKHRQDFHLWIRMLYSCLVDADFIDTETHMNCGPKDRGVFDSMETLSERFFKHMEKFNNPKNALNSLRNEILESCKQAAQKSEGFFELAVPTGGGKTLSSMAFALMNAQKFSHRRIIYAIPYTSIIEQTSKELKDIFGQDQVVEHHSNIDCEKDTQKSRLACENWDAPIIVTTNVEFFESLYSNRPSRCRKLHNIANSVIVLDESQMLPMKLSYPIEDIARQLVENYKCVVVFSTATQNCFSNIGRIEKIIPDSMGLYDKLKRVHYNFQDAQDESSWEDIAESLKQYKRVLCVVNTRKDCFDLFKLMPQGTVHLSALMCADHRSEKIKLIKERLKNGGEIRVISTQLIEAGVDIDFPAVFRAFAGLPSIVQAAGRCNREGKAEKGEVFIFNPPSKIPSGLMLKAANVTRDMMGLDDFDMDSAHISKIFFERFAHSVNSCGKKELETNLIRDAQEGKFEFAQYAKQFKLIDDWNKTVIVRHNGGKKLIDELRFRPIIDRDLMRRLQRYMVNVHPTILDKLQAHGLVEKIGDNIELFIQEDMDGFYNQDVGLNVFDKKYGMDALV